jgi:3',5'-nucleoside bisphosphate phosphatase
MASVYDFHCHSTASDGALPPAEVVARAHRQGVQCLALTDHDTVAGLDQARNTAHELGVRLINGIELSSTYHGQCLHIVGLQIDTAQPLLLDGLREQQQCREQRAMQIGEKLAKKRIPDAYATIKAQVGDGEITRSHFAEFLVAKGYVSDAQHAFDRYLSKGKPAYVSTQWASLETVIAWISAAGGIAVLAHPLRYKLSKKWLNRVLADFVEYGGRGIEVVTGRSGVDDIVQSAHMARRYGLHASVGSDFHSPQYPWVELGRLGALPEDLMPVWQLFE